jgi:hypothetical protein
VKVGRNDPCPCGSGLKYKNCHLRSDAGNVSTDPLWQRQHELNQRLPGELLRFVKSTYGWEIVREAWRDFMLDEHSEFDPDSRQLPIFMPWFYYEWRPDPKSEVSGQTTQFPIAAGYLDRKGYFLERLAVSYVTAAMHAGLSFFEVLEVKPGKSIGLRDVLTGDAITVTEKTASKTAQRGDIFLARVVQLDRLAVLDACAPIAFPPLEKAPIIDLRNQILEKHATITAQVAREYLKEILRIYHSTAERLLHPKMPKLANTDGEPLAFCRVTYEIPSPRAAFDALRHLSLGQTESELLEGATFDSAGGLESVELPWLKAGNRQMPWQNTSLGLIRIDGRRLLAEVNSEQRAKRFRRIADAKLPAGSRHLSTVIESAEAAIEAHSRGNPDRANEQESDLNEPPEIQALLRDHLTKYYRQWVDIGVPALGGQTPRQAVKTKDGREMVETLLLDMERRESGGVRVEINREIAAELRSTLGLN